jgi:hypothetical protein
MPEADSLNSKGRNLLRLQNCLVLLGERPRALSPDEIEYLIDQYSDGTKRAREVGFDAVELDGGYGHLIGQFIALRIEEPTPMGRFERTAICAKMIEAT